MSDEPHSETEALNAALADAFETGDVETAAAFFAATAVLLPARGRALAGREAVAAFLNGARNRASGWVFTASDVKPLGSQIRRETGTYTMLAGGAQGTPTVGKYMMIWQMVEDRWMIESCIWTRNPEPTAGQGQGQGQGAGQRQGSPGQGPLRGQGGGQGGGGGPQGPGGGRGGYGGGGGGGGQQRQGVYRQGGGGYRQGGGRGGIGGGAGVTGTGRGGVGGGGGRRGPQQGGPRYGSPGGPNQGQGRQGGSLYDETRSLYSNPED